MSSDSLVEKATSLASSGQISEGYKLLDGAAWAGDAHAAYALGEWRLTGQFIRRDLGLAREFFGRAADLGLPAAQGPYIAMLANGAGGTPRRWAEALDRLNRLAQRDPMTARQAKLIELMEIEANGDPKHVPASLPLNDSPRIATFQGFLTQAECAYLIDRAEPLLRDAFVLHPATGALIRDPIRTSRSMAFPFVAEEPLMHAINRRIAAATGTTYEQGEPTQNSELRARPAVQAA